MALRNILNNAADFTSLPVFGGGGNPILSAGLRTIARRLPDGQQYQTVSSGQEPQQDFKGLFGTNQDYAGEGGFNYATQEAADAAQQSGPTDDFNYDSAWEGGDMGGGPISASDLAHTANQIGGIYQGMTTGDLYNLRSRLAYEQGIARFGGSPDSDVDKFVQLAAQYGGGDESTFDYGQLNDMYGTFADNVYGTQVDSLDNLLRAQSEGAGSGSGSGESTPMEIDGVDITGLPDTMIRGTGGTADERAVVKSNLINAIQSGNADEFLNQAYRVAQTKMTAPQQEDIATISEQSNQLSSALTALAGTDIKFNNVKGLLKDLKKKFGAGTPEYDAILFMTEGPSAAQRNKIFGASLTGNEQKAASRFVITPADNNVTIKFKAAAMLATLEQAEQNKYLLASGLSKRDIESFSKAGIIPSYAESLRKYGVPESMIPKELGQQKSSSQGSTQSAPSGGGSSWGGWN